MHLLYVHNGSIAEELVVCKVECRLMPQAFISAVEHHTTSPEHKEAAGLVGWRSTKLSLTHNATARDISLPLSILG